MKKITQGVRNLVMQTFEKQVLLCHLQCSVINISHGQVDLLLPKSPLALQQHRFFSGGIISTLGDVSSGLSAYASLQDQKDTAITVQFKCNFLRPADGQVLRAYGKVLKSGKSLMVSTAEIYTGNALHNQDDKLCAFFIQTVSRIRDDRFKQNLR